MSFRAPDASDLGRCGADRQQWLKTWGSPLFDHAQQRGPFSPLNLTRQLLSYLR